MSSSSSSNTSNGNNGFKELDNKLLSDYEKDADFKDFLRDPKDFRSLQHVMTLLRDVNVFGSTAFNQNPIYIDLLEKKKVAENNIEKVVKFQHGGLNNTVDTMSEVVKSYVKGRDEIKTVCESLSQTKEVLSNKKTNQQKLRELWLRKLELEESLRIIKDIEYVKGAPSRIHKLISQRRYLTAVTTLKQAHDKMFHEDLTAVTGLSQVHKTISDLKESVVEKILNELQDAIHGSNVDSEDANASDSGDESISDSRSESLGSTITTAYDNHSVADTSFTTGSHSLGSSGSGSGTNSSNSYYKDNNYDILLQSSSIDIEHVKNLLNLTDVMEDKIVNPSKTGLLFIRFLVKALSDLYNEDDYIEELLFHHLSDKFQITIMRPERRKASVKLQRKLEEKEIILLENGDDNGSNNSNSYDIYDDDNDGGNGNAEEDDNNDEDTITSRPEIIASSSGDTLTGHYSIHAKVFSSFINNILNHSIACFRTISYVLRLLNFSRQLRQIDYDDEEENQKSQYDDGNSVYSDDDDGDDNDNGYNNKNDDNNRNRMSINSQTVNNNNAAQNNLTYIMNDSNKERIRKWWHTVENMICDELKMHMIEVDVENISDNTNKKTFTTATSATTSGNMSLSKPTLNTTSSLSKIGQENDDNEFAYSNAIVSEPIVPPTAKLAASIYKKVIKHHDVTSKLMLEEGLYLSIGTSPNGISNNSNSSSGSSSSADQSNNIQFTKPVNTYLISGNNSKLTILQQMALSERQNSLTIFKSALLCFMNKFLEKELLPITQSYINSEMRDIQANSILFNYRLQNQLAEDARARSQTMKGLATNNNNNNNNNNRNSIGSSGAASTRQVEGRRRRKKKLANVIKFMNQDLLLNNATLKCCTVAQLLYSYWVDLCNHRDMVMTILDRLIRGFVSCANNEIENISWKSISGETKYLSQTLNVLLTSDELFLLYRQKLYKGDISIEQVIAHKSNNHDFKSHNSSNNTNGTSSSSTSNSYYNFLKSPVRTTNERGTSFSASTTNSPSTPNNITNSNNNNNNNNNNNRSLPEITIWALLFGNIGNSSNYPVTKNKTVKDIAQLETIASILQGCEWMSFELIKYCAKATARNLKDATQTNDAQQQLQHQQALSMLSASTLPPRDETETQRAKAASRQLREMHAALWNVTEGISKELAKVSENCLAFLKSEAQIICFLHLNQLANVVSLKATFISRTGGPVIASNIPKDTTTKNGTSTSSSSSSSSSQSVSMNKNTVAASRNSKSLGLMNDTTEAEIILDELIQHIKVLHSVLKPVLPREIIVFIIFPLCSIIPRILMRCFQHLISPVSLSSSNFGQHNYMNELPLDPAVVYFSLDSGKYLRIVIAIQQLLTSLIESFQLDPNMTRLFIDKLIDESERLRKFLKLLEMTPKELKGYIRENPDEYTSLEYITLWDTMCARSSEKQIIFEDFWKKIKVK